MFKFLAITTVLILGACVPPQLGENPVDAELFGCTTVRTTSQAGMIGIGAAVSTYGYKCYITDDQYKPELDKMLDSLVNRQL